MSGSLLLRLKTSRKEATKSKKKHLTVELDAITDNEELLEDVIKELVKGITIYTAADFNTELNKVLREHVAKVEEENEELLRKLHQAEIQIEAYKAGVLPLPECPKE